MDALSNLVFQEMPNYSNVYKHLCSLIANELSQPSRSSTPQSYVSGGMEARSPVPSSESGVFDNNTQRKKSQPHSDKGYGSTTSVSSCSSGDSKLHELC